MKKTLLYLFVVLLGIQFVYSQDNTKVHEFQGGNINFDLTYYTGFIYGIGSRNLNTNSSLENYGAESIYWNPAGLAFMEKSQLFVDYAPPLNVNPKAFVDFQDEINTSVDDEFKSDLTDNAIYTYPDFCAAAAPMAGGGLLREGPSPFNALAVKDVAIWSFYGDQDPICDYQFMRNNFDSSAAVGGNFKLTTLIGAKHGIGNWIEYAGEDSIAVRGTSTTHAVTHECSTEGVCDMEEMVFIEWLFKQERKPTYE